MIAIKNNSKKTREELARLIDKNIRTVQRILNGLVRLHSTHYEEVKATIEDALKRGVEFYKIELDFKPDGVSLHKVYKTIF